MEQSITRWVLGHQVTCFSPSGDYDFMVGETPAKTQGPPPHLHYSFTEAFYVLEGEMDFFLNGVTNTVKAGEFVDLPLNALHTFANNADVPCKWINIHSPKGFAKFFGNIGVEVSEDNARERSVAPEVFKEVAETASSYGMYLKL